MVPVNAGENECVPPRHESLIPSSFTMYISHHSRLGFNWLGGGGGSETELTASFLEKEPKHKEIKENTF